jgi:hypothetical protein
MNGGYVYNYAKNYTNRVRPVAPVVAAAASAI